jgi:hypothetical protein
MTRKEPDRLCFGVITDIHHSRSAEPAALLQEAADLQRCIEWWQEEDGVGFVVQLGDLISSEGAEAEIELDEVHSMLRRFPGKMVHVAGNHCLAVPLGRFISTMHMPAPYYSFTIDAYRFIVLNSMDVSVLAEPDNEFDREMLARYRADPLLHDYCGAIGRKQLQWLERELDDAAHEERVVVLCHLPLLPETTDEKHGLLWNHEEVTAILCRCRNLIACFSGHYHPGAYATRGSVAFIALPGFIHRTDPPFFSCGRVDIQSDRITVCNEKQEVFCNHAISGKPQHP